MMNLIFDDDGGSGDGDDDDNDAYFHKSIIVTHNEP